MSAAAAAEAEAPRPAVSRITKLRAWWHGVDAQALSDAGEDGSAGDADAPRADATAAAETPAPADLWSEDRIAAVEALWGHGHVRPGGDTFTLNFVRPMALTPAMSIIDMRAGLGGAARALVDTFGLWIAGYEPVEPLAVAGHERSIYGGMARKAPIQTYDPATVELKASRYDAAVAFELFSHVRDKNGLFERIVASLKEPAQIMFTEFALKTKGDQPPEIAAWREIEPDVSDLWTLGEYRDMCEDAKLDIRICDDFSDDYRRAALFGWSEAVQQFRPGTHPANVVALMLEELERWSRRLAAIESGALRVVRIHAFKKSKELK